MAMGVGEHVEPMLSVSKWKNGWLKVEASS